jgi:hypothetical protein
MRATRRQHDEISWQKHVLFGAFHKWRYNYTPSPLDGLFHGKSETKMDDWGSPILGNLHFWMGYAKGKIGCPTVYTFLYIIIGQL